MAVVSSQNFSGATRRARLRGESRSRNTESIAGRLCEAIEKRALRIGDLDGATTERLRHAVLSGIHRQRSHAMPSSAWDGSSNI